MGMKKKVSKKPMKEVIITRCANDAYWRQGKIVAKKWFKYPHNIKTPTKKQLLKAKYLEAKREFEDERYKVVLQEQKTQEAATRFFKAEAKYRGSK